MNRHFTSRNRCRGVTLVEILIVLAVLVVLASFAIPSVGNATARAELTAATENVRYSVESARKFARATASPVVLRVTGSGDPAGQSIVFGREGSGAEGQDYRLPGDVRLVTTTESFVFDDRGLVAEPGRWVLVSTVDDALSETIAVD